MTIMPIFSISYFSFSHLQIFTLLNGLEVKQLLICISTHLNFICSCFST